jgi:hypothetical protein
MMGNDPASELQKRTLYNRFAGDRMATVSRETLPSRPTLFIFT